MELTTNKSYGTDLNHTPAAVPADIVDIYDSSFQPSFREKKEFPSPPQQQERAKNKKVPVTTIEMIKLMLLVLCFLILVASLILMILTYIDSHKIERNGAESGNMSLSCVDENQWLIKNVSMLVNTQTAYHESSAQLLSYIIDAISHQQNTTQAISDAIFHKQNLTYSMLVDTLSHIQRTARAVSDVLLAVEQLSSSQVSIISLPTSCKQVKSLQPNSSTGHYCINNRDTFCYMEELCGSGGGWTRLGYLDMSDPSESCPVGFQLYTSGDVRACGRPYSNIGSCASVKFPTNGVNYSEICGRVIGYQDQSTDAHVVIHANITLDISYVDGVSITRGSPRQHVWTLMAGLSEPGHPDWPNYICPCNNGSFSSTFPVPSFVGSNYFCESGNPNDYFGYHIFTSDPLWDGQGCNGNESPCCLAPGLPWFHRTYQNETNDYIELRACCDQNTGQENALVALYEIYVK